MKILPPPDCLAQSKDVNKIDDVDETRGKIKVMVSMFGRETPLELDFLQVKKV